MGTHTERLQRGFTLIEVIVSLAVLSVASWIIVALFTASMNLGARARHERMAAEIAEEALVNMGQQPRFYQWGEGDAPRTELFPVTLAGSSEAQPLPATPPVTLPAERGAAARNRAEYERFTWEAYARLPGDNAAYYEVTVAVRWQDSGRDRVFTLTRAVARQPVEEAP
jgi:prepilin-type N-terminal cleavage/methylation domain-containing protein